MLIHNLTPEMLKTCVVLERTASVLTLLGFTFIMTTYAFSRAFSKPINRLIFLASLGNIFTNIGTLISRSALPAPGAPSSGTCKFQAFLLQMFIPADAWWTFAMACNVWLIFYHKFDLDRLRALEKWYFAICYGVPFVPAVVFIGINTAAKGNMYGNALLWCWINSTWDRHRIYCFYAPTWVILMLTILIYIRVGKQIWLNRRKLHGFGKGSSTGESSMPHGIQHSTQITMNYEETGPNGVNCDISTTRPRRQPAKSHGQDDKLLSYIRVASLFFIAMMVTWVPSSANRVYSDIHTGKVSLGLLYLAAFVLPLQGLWNAVIYASINWGPCREFWGSIFRRKSSIGVTMLNDLPSGGPRFGRKPHTTDLDGFDTTSQTELHVRPDVKE